MLCRVRGYEPTPHVLIYLVVVPEEDKGKLYLATKRSTRAAHQLQDTHFNHNLKERFAVFQSSLY